MPFPRDLLPIWVQIKEQAKTARGGAKKPEPPKHFEDDLTKLDKQLKSKKPDVAKVRSLVSEVIKNMMAYHAVLAAIPAEAEFKKDIGHFIKTVLRGILELATKLHQEGTVENRQMKSLLLNFTKLANLADLRKKDVKTLNAKLAACTTQEMADPIVRKINDLFQEVNELQHMAQDLQGQMVDLE